MNSDGRHGFSFLVCPDGQLLRTHLEQLVTENTPAQGIWERHVYWGDEDPPPRFWEQLTLQGLFGTPRLLVARQAHLWSAAVWKKISHALAHPGEQCWPVFCLEGRWEKGRPKVPAHILKLRCLSFADKQGWVWRQDGLNERGVKRYVLQRAKARGLTFTPDALEQFCVSVPPYGQAIENELDKFSLLCDATCAKGVAPDKGHITNAMISAAWSSECNVFSCIRHMEAGNLPAVWKELSHSTEDDSLLFSLLGLLARELRLFWSIQTGESVRLHSSDAAYKHTLAARLEPRTLSEGMTMIMDAELQVKNGNRTPKQGLEFLATQMTALFAAASRQSR